MILQRLDHPPLVILQTERGSCKKFLVLRDEDGVVVVHGQSDREGGEQKEYSFTANVLKDQATVLKKEDLPSNIMSPRLHTSHLNPSAYTHKPNLSPPKTSSVQVLEKGVRREEAPPPLRTTTPRVLGGTMPTKVHDLGGVGPPQKNKQPWSQEEVHEVGERDCAKESKDTVEHETIYFCHRTEDKSPQRDISTHPTFLDVIASLELTIVCVSQR